MFRSERVGLLLFWLLFFCWPTHLLNRHPLLRIEEIREGEFFERIHAETLFVDEPEAFVLLRTTAKACIVEIASRYRAAALGIAIQTPNRSIKCSRKEGAHRKGACGGGLPHKERARKPTAKQST
jgi:hypothetical protein